MTALSAEIPLGHATDKPSHAVRILQVYCIAVMVFPSNYDLKIVGADGYPAALVSYLALALWTAGTLLGHHDAFARRYPVRAALAFIWAATIASYVLMHRASMNGEQLLSANRWLMQLAGMSGVVLVAAEGLRSMADVRRVLRALTWGGAFCGTVAALQFAAKINLTQYLVVPGFSRNVVASGTAVIIQRGSLNRVFGTATDPIELGSSAGILLALALYLLMYDTGQAKWKRVIPVSCIALSVGASVSRSAIIAAAASVGVLIVLLPPLRRLKALAIVPLALGVLLLAAPTLVSTLTSFFLAGTSDPSVAHRTNNYPYVEQLVRQSPWVGPGPNTVIPSELHVLDNQYLSTAINMGLLGVAALVFYLGWPAVVAIAARRRSMDPELRDLCATVAGTVLAAALCSATFDGFSFPMFYNLQALTAGLAGAAWMLASKEQDELNAKSAERLESGFSFDRRDLVAAQDGIDASNLSNPAWGGLRLGDSNRYLSGECQGSVDRPARAADRGPDSSGTGPGQELQPVRESGECNVGR
jgi:O-antigen ligase